MNKRLVALGYSNPHLIVNFNYMYMALVGIILLFLVLYVIGRCSKSEKIMGIGAFFLKDIGFAFLFFNVSNMGFSFGLQCRYLMLAQEWEAPLYLSWVFAVLSLVLLIIYLAYYVKITFEF
jgi:hypothetical protein